MALGVGAEMGVGVGVWVGWEWGAGAYAGAGEVLGSGLGIEHLVRSSRVKPTLTVWPKPH